ncbi:hypothetical protein EWU23_09220 [Cytophagaceae bacterium 50C-KIRBA]|uniref:HPr kinase/phosphorylase C-terminal domain-containing protein n=1 Tax=Aquirufa beregesia TaxID=2516556 RepID=A0ABX0EZI4_9BACT|nr:hypothetical protein [Aquirufa beregesia]NGZ44657.1 hypothetical protein [Aquirufa beregesia]
MSYQYSSFGLLIQSDLEFPEFVDCHFEYPDLIISIGKVPSKLKFSPLIEEPHECINDREYYLEVENVAKYYAFDGRELIVEYNSEADKRTIRIYLLATVMAAILHQRNSIPLHASSIKWKDGLVVISGESGAGKSTTVSGLLKSGYSIFSDDVLVLKQDEDQEVAALASYPLIKLWDDAIQKLQSELFESRDFVVKPGYEKFGFFFHEHFDVNPYYIKLILVLKIKEVNHIEYKELQGGEAFKEFMAQSYRPNLLHSNALRALNYAMLVSILKNAKLVVVHRPPVCNPEELLSHIETIIQHEYPV